jgi:hypothetical protein
MVCPCIRPACGAIEINEWRARLVGVTLHSSTAALFFAVSREAMMTVS